MEAHGDGLLLQTEHELPFIPVVAELIQGTVQGETPELQRKPPLYNYWKSGMWQADNLFFTTTFSNIFAMLTMPPFMSEQTIQDEVGKPEIDFDAKPPVVDLPYGRKLSQLQMRVITPDIMTLHDLAQSKGIESTMYRQAMGEPLSGSPSYSLVAFLAQSSKTVLNTIVEKTSWLIADIAKIGLCWMRHDSGTYPVKYGQDKVSIMSAEIPEGDFQVDCMLKVKLPQDLLGASQIVAQLASIPGFPVSMEWLVEQLERQRTELGCTPAVLARQEDVGKACQRCGGSTVREDVRAPCARVHGARRRRLCAGCHRLPAAPGPARRSVR